DSFARAGSESNQARRQLRPYPRKGTCRLDHERQDLSLLVVLFDASFLVIDVQRRHHAVGDHAGAEPTGCAPGDPSVEDQADLAGPAEIEILPDHLLEEDASSHWLIEYLGERELGLQDRYLIAISRSTVARRKRMRQSLEPFAQQSIDPIR